MDRTKFQSGKVITISIAHLIHDIYSSFLAPILPLLIDKLSISYSLAGMLSLFQRIPSLFNPFVGLLADKLELRLLLISAPAITATSMSLLGVAPSYTILAILLFVMGIGASLFHVPAPVIVKQISGMRIGKGMSFFMFGGEIARSIGPLIILGAVSLWGLEGTYKLIPFGIAASGVLYYKLRDINTSQKMEIKDKQQKIWPSLKEHKDVFIIIAGITLFSSILRGAFTAFLPTYLSAEGESLWMGGIALSALQLTGAAGTFLSGTMSDKITPKRTLLIILIIGPLLAWLFILSSSTLRIPILLALGFFLFSTTPVMLAIINNLKTDRPAFLNGIYMTLNFSLGAIAVVIVGLGGDLFGLALTYKISALITLLSIPFVLKL